MSILTGGGAQSEGGVEGMEGLLEILVELYTDAFSEVRSEYLEKLELIRQEGDFGSFRDITELKRAIEAEGYDHNAKFFW